MSRIGNAPIEIPQGVEVTILEDKIKIKGPKGEMVSPMFQGIQADLRDDIISIKRENDTKDLKAKHGLSRALLSNCIKGVFSGFSKSLILQGVGYKASKKEKKLILALGFSHEVLFDEPDDVSIEVSEQTHIKVSGIDKQRVGQIASQIRAFRPPEPYKGRGIHYEGERIRRKAGKAGKK